MGVEWLCWSCCDVPTPSRSPLEVGVEESEESEDSQGGCGCELSQKEQRDKDLEDVQHAVAGRGGGARKAGKQSLIEDVLQSRILVTNFSSEGLEGDMVPTCQLVSDLLKRDNVGNDPSYMRSSTVVVPCRNSCLPWPVLEVMRGNKDEMTVSLFNARHARVRKEPSTFTLNLPTKLHTESSH